MRRRFQLWWAVVVAEHRWYLLLLVTVPLAFALVYWLGRQVWVVSYTHDFRYLAYRAPILLEDEHLRIRGCYHSDGQGRTIAQLVVMNIRAITLRDVQIAAFVDGQPVHPPLPAINALQGAALGPLGKPVPVLPGMRQLKIPLDYGSGTRLRLQATYTVNSVPPQTRSAFGEALLTPCQE